MKKVVCLLLSFLLLAALTQPALAAQMGEIDRVYAETGAYLDSLGTPKAGGLNGEWRVLGEARGGREVGDGYYEDVCTYVQEHIDENGRLNPSRVTMNCRFIVALTALGKDVTNVNGHNLLSALDDMAYVRKSGISGITWTLVSLDCGQYPNGINVTRQALVNELLSLQVPGGGWAVSGNIADPDMTAMTMQALAIYKDDSKVAAALEKGLAVLSNMQDGTGNFPSQYGASSESVAQIVVALSTLGIDANADERFVKNGTSALDALVSYEAEGGGFRHILTGKRDGMATEQGYYALTAYKRFLNGQLPLYHMWDASTAPENPKAKQGISFLWLYATLGAGFLAVTGLWLLRKKLGKRKSANATMAVAMLMIVALGIGAAVNLGLLQPKGQLGSQFAVKPIAGNRLVQSENPEHLCTITIRCDTIVENLSKLDNGKAPYVPADGVILPEITVEFAPGQSVFDVLRRVCEEAQIALEYSWAPMYDAYYMEGMNHLYELDCGTESGWMYRVNGTFPNYGCSDFEVQDGDAIEWLYTCVGLGADLNR